jgi:hypothetical protein
MVMTAGSTVTRSIIIVTGCGIEIGSSIGATGSPSSDIPSIQQSQWWWWYSARIIITTATVTAASVW